MDDASTVGGDGDGERAIERGDRTRDELQPGRFVRVGLAAGYAALFIVAQVLLAALVLGVLRLASGERWVQQAVEDPAGVRGVTFLLVVEALLVVVALVVVRRGPGMRAVGLAATPAETRRAWRLVVPLVALIAVPALVDAGASAAPLIAPDVTLVRGTLLVFFACAIGAAEEIFFRGLIVWRLGGTAYPWLAIAVSSVLFGLPHLATAGDASAAHVLNAGAVALMVGVPFAVIRCAGGALGPLIVVHAMIDVWAFLHLGDIQPTGDPSIGMAAGVLGAAVVVAAAYAGWLARDRRRTPRTTR